MALQIKPETIDALLLGHGDRRRQLQSLPILGEVWTELALRPDDIHDLLITPHYDIPAARVAAVLSRATAGEPTGKDGRRISYLNGVVAARLSLEDIWSALLPMTAWWEKRIRELEASPSTPGSDNQFWQSLDARISAQFEIEQTGRAEANSGPVRAGERQLIQLGVLLGVLCVARDATGHDTSDEPVALSDGAFTAEEVGARGGNALREGRHNLGWLQKREDEAQRGSEGRPEATDAWHGIVWMVTLNRPAAYATERSVLAIKADAARQLFAIDCSDIGWAVIDSGIDASHKSFRKCHFEDAQSRVVATYDFGGIRRILNSGNNFDEAARDAIVDELKAAQVCNRPGGPRMSRRQIERSVKTLARAIKEERPLDWKLVEPLIRRDGSEEHMIPVNPHGTHVAGILGGYWEEPGVNGAPVKVKQAGVCRDIQLYDLRVLGPDAEQTEFAVISALQFVGFLNRRNAYRVIDGINLSVAILHNVRNYACGQTPVCLEAEARVSEGVVVVAAAGNRGYQSVRLADGTNSDGYASSSISDPGNAEGVITVGATHRSWPHTYGVSFFSSRGPTGDGRQKPDLLAPGERIVSSVPDQALDEMDGTSMAAPHVSGAAALLMARHRELRGKPGRIKAILCGTATDLGRERSFQGSGMVDVLRAIQSV